MAIAKNYYDGLKHLGHTPDYIDDEGVLQERDFGYSITVDVDGNEIVNIDWHIPDPGYTQQQMDDAADAAEIILSQTISAIESARLSAIQKLVTAAGLTADEQTAFFGG